MWTVRSSSSDDPRRSAGLYRKPQKPFERKAVAPYGSVGERESRVTTQQCRQRDARLQACERRAEAVVDAAAERQRRVVRTVQHEAIGVAEALRVTVAGREVGHDPFASTDRDTTELDRFDGHAR